MCGIIGQLHQNIIVDIALFNSKRDTLTHRGPDDADTKILQKGKVHLGHRRLSVIDLSKKGQQPMCNESGTIWLVFNGEIYNFKLLRKKLIKKGHQFKSNTDSEVLLHGYEEWGINGLLKRIKGMFAFALWDEEKEKLFAARDRFGIKPFYFWLQNEQFLFASEIKAIIKGEKHKPVIDFTAMADYLVYRFIPSPKTIYKSIKKLPPAHFLTYTYKDHQVSIDKYWELSNETISDCKNIQQKSEQYLSSSIKQQLISDVPIGVFLSSGYDSSTIVHYLHQFKYPTQTFTIGFEDWKKSEHLAAREIADLYQTKHNEQVLSNNIANNLSEFFYYCDEPIGGSSFIPTFAVAKLASKTVKVVFGGDGGDEIYAGYNWYYRILEYSKSLAYRLKTYWYGDNFLLQLYANHMSWSGFTYSEVNHLLNYPYSKNKIPNDLWLYQQNDQPILPILKRLQLLDLKTFLPEVILTKVDRASMAHSLEVRVPFLDYELVEFLFSLPTKTYFKLGVKKKLLFQMIQNHFPKAILKKPKQGFSAPIHKNNLFDNYYYEKVKNGMLVKNNIVNKKRVEQYIKQKNNKKIWAIFLLELWYEAWAN